MKIVAEACKAEFVILIELELFDGLTASQREEAEALELDSWFIHLTSLHGLCFPPFGLLAI